MQTYWSVYVHVCTHKKENGEGLDIVTFKKQVAGVNSLLRVFTRICISLAGYSG